MTRVYLANAFSLSMLPLNVNSSVTVNVARVDASTFTQLLTKLGVDECVIGHPSTVKLAEKLLGKTLNCQRKAIRINPGDMLFVIQPTIRLPEGKILSDEEISELAATGKIAFFIVLLNAVSSEYGG